MAFSSGTVSVGTTAASIVTPGSPVLVKNNGPEAVFLGGASTVTADVSATGGWVLEPGDVLLLPPFLPPNGWYASNALYGITASGTADVSWLLVL